MESALRFKGNVDHPVIKNSVSVAYESCLSEDVTELKRGLTTDTIRSYGSGELRLYFELYIPHWK